ncbi:MAG: MFS transporter [Muribaculaceae bacterium]|nr:MFS transporter [Muribaculaceae bacterium]
MNNGNFSLKVRLAIMSFLEFAVWGAYLTSLGNYLGRVGLANDIKWFYAIQGIVSIFMPAIIGIVADRWIHAQRMLSICHLIAGIFMGAAGIYGMMAGEAVEFHTIFWFYAVSVAFFMPTIGLSNSVAYSALTKVGLDTVKEFPPIRVFGTVGFICAMLFVNFTQYQTNYCQLITSGILSGALCIYALTLPDCPTNKAASNSISDMLGLKAFSLFKQKKMATFFIFSMLLGVSLQITNGYGNVFITSFKDVAEFANTWGAQNANALISLSQMSETLCILLIPFFLKRIGIKGMMLMSMFAWVGRFGFFGIGNPGDLVWLFVLSMIVYGIAFDFFNVSGSLYVDQETDPSIRSSAQGLFMIMTNGLGATIGTLSAGAILEKFVFTQPAGVAQIDGWHTSWLIFAAYAFVVGVLLALIFKENRKEKISKSEAADKNGLAAGGIIDDKDQI